MNKKELPQSLVDYVNANNLIEIKGGLQRKEFLEIWMVAIGNRVFARSWQKSKRSWFTALLEEQRGQIKYGDKIIAITGEKMIDDHTNVLIDRAYKQKYIQEQNLFYVDGITQPEYKNFTMEFFMIN